MKVDGGNGKLYDRDHPHEIISPHVFTFEVIRFWLKELSTNPDYGWTKGGRAGLERSLGLTKKGIERKLTTAWIWPKEQVRLTARIKDILAGYIVPRKFGAKTEGVITDPPTPPVVKVPQKCIRLQAVIGQSILAPQKMAPRQRLPDFKHAFLNVRFWNPDK